MVWAAAVSSESMGLQCDAQTVRDVRLFFASWHQSMVIVFLGTVLRTGIFVKPNSISPLLHEVAPASVIICSPPTAKIVPCSLSTLPNFGGLSRSDGHLPVICRVSFGGDTGSRPAPMRFACPYDRTGWLDASKTQRFCQLLSRVPIPPYSGSTTAHVAIVENAIREAAIVAFPRTKRAKIQESASDPIFELIVQRGHRAWLTPFTTGAS